MHSDTRYSKQVMAWKRQAKGKIVPVRFTEAELKLFSKAVKAGDQNTLSDWISETLRVAAEK